MKATRGLLSALALVTLPGASLAHDHAQHDLLQGQKLAATQRLRSSAPGLTVLGGASSEVRPAHRTAVGSALEVGAEVCITGYIMDNYCIYDNGGNLLDHPSVQTLEGPELHNYFCLIDAKPCYGSDFQVLGPKDPETGMHCPGFRLDEATQAIIDAVRAEAGCTPGVHCQGQGYAATIKGKIKEEGDGTDTRQGPPLLTDIQVLDRNVGCDGADTIPPLCGGEVSAPQSESAPAPKPEPATAPTP